MGVTGGTLALLLNTDGTKVLEALRRAAVQRGRFRQRERDERAGGLEHDDHFDYSAAPLTVAIGGISATTRLRARERGGDGVERVNFEFRDDHGNFGFRRTRAGLRRRRTR